MTFNGQDEINTALCVPSRNKLFGCRDESTSCAVSKGPLKRGNNIEYARSPGNYTALTSVGSAKLTSLTGVCMIKGVGGVSQGFGEATAVSPSQLIAFEKPFSGGLRPTAAVSPGSSVWGLVGHRNADTVAVIRSVRWR